MQKLFLVFLLFLLITPTQVHATTKLAVPSATFSSNSSGEVDYRAKSLRLFLSKYDSPLTDSAETFIGQADKNKIDWKLLAAISGVESTFGKQIPYETHNAWGWGIYGDNRIYFKSFDEGIAIISQALKEKYIDRMGSDNVYTIGRMYAASPTWGVRVEQFMNMIQEAHEASSTAKLTITL